MRRRDLIRQALLSVWAGICICSYSAAAQLQKTGTWEPFEITMNGSVEQTNPYVDGLPDGGESYVIATFTGTKGEARGSRYRVPGFWDGGKVWKVRFAAPKPGEWSYTVSSPDPALRDKKGTFQCDAWTAAEIAAGPWRHGFVRIARSGPRAGRYFEYADGTPFLWIGDTWWPMLRSEFPFARAKQVIDDRSARGFTVGQVMFAANSATQLAGPDFATPNLDAIHRAEQVIAYANSQGITLWIMPLWGGKQLDRTVGPDKIRRWARYVLDRLASFNVIWNLSGEYNMYNYGGLGLQFWKDLGALMRREDPYGHAIGVHNTPPGWAGGEAGDSAQWSTGAVLHGEPWLDFNGSQVGHGKWRNEMVPQIISKDYARRPAKPVLITESWYEFVEGSAPAMDIRFAAWSAILSGAAGHTYGGGHQWWADVPDPSSPLRKGEWPSPPPGVDTLDYAGAKSIGFLARFLKGIEWWMLEPHPELVLEYPQPLAAAITGRQYLVYVRYGGQLKLDLRSTSPAARFRFTWIDLVSSKEAQQGSVNGGAIRTFHTPEDYPGQLEYKDWLLDVVKVD